MSLITGTISYLHLWVSKITPIYALFLHQVLFFQKNQLNKIKMAAPIPETETLTGSSGCLVQCKHFKLLGTDQFQFCSDLTFISSPQ